MNPDLRFFLDEVGKHIAPVGETTIFALGGRSYYEDPASDLLKIFLDPDAEHGLGNLFLSTYLECMKVDPGHINFSNVSVEREVQTAQGNYIDLQIQRPDDWCLIIENKIYHQPANPFMDYEAHAEQFPKNTNLFSIVSPNGILPPEGSATPGRWKAVSYKDYCQKLRDRIAAKFFHGPFSKWHIFAREFILHIENELGLNNQPMKPEDAKFVEDNTDKFAEAQKLVWQYQEFVCNELKQRLEVSIPPQIFNTKDDSWAFRCTTLPRWGSSDVVLIKPEVSGQKKFKIRAYICPKDMSDSQLSTATQALNLGQPVIDGTHYYWTSVGYDTRDEAIYELCKLAQIVNGLMKN